MDERSWHLVTRWVKAAGLACALALTACSTDGRTLPSGEASGSIGVKLTTSGGARLDSVGYTITGPGGFSRVGSIDVSQTASSSAFLAGLPAGSGYTITLRATSADGAIQCTGTASFDVVAGQTTSVPIALQCSGPTTTGSVAVHATTQFCPVLDAIAIAPLSVVVGGRIELSGSAHDPDPGPAPLSYAWSASSGSLKDPHLARAQFRCSAAGPATITLSVSDGTSGSPGCPATFDADVSCLACGQDGSTCSDGNECTLFDACRADACLGTPAPARSTCQGSKLCDGAGECVECIVGNDCPGQDGACSLRVCTAGKCGVSVSPAGTRIPQQTSGDCHVSQCDGLGNVLSVPDNNDLPSDNNPCTADTCTSGVPSNPPLAAETQCDGTRVCDGTGRCVACVVAADCAGADTSCTRRTCAANVCGVALSGEGTACADNGGQICDGAGSCVQPSFRVLRVDAGGAALSPASAPVFIDRRKLDGSLLGSLALPTAPSGSNQPLTLMGISTTEGQLARSVDGRYITLTGYASAPGAATISTTAASAVKRVVARIDAAGSIDTSSVLASAFSFGSPRSAVSVDGSAFWVSGSGVATPPAPTPAGVWYLPLGSSAGVQLVASNLRYLGIFGAQLYGDSDALPALEAFTIGSGLPTSGTQPTSELSGLPTVAGPSPWSFALFDRSASVPGVDTLYLADDRSTTGRGIQKWTFNGVSWSLAAIFNLPTPAGFRGLAGLVTGSTISLMATTSDTGSQPSRIVVFVDDGSPSPAASVVATAPLNVVYRGVAANPHP